MELKQIKERIAAAIEEHAEEIFRIAGQIYQNPEAGYDEKKTSARIREVLEQYEIPYTYPHALTGVKASLQGKRSEARVCIMGELDAVRCSAHPDAKEGGVVHACGHHAQLAAMLAAAIGMKKSGVMDELDGDVCFFAVPAEEFIDLEYRKSLKDAGKICAYGGKQQLIAEGAFDDIETEISGEKICECTDVTQWEDPSFFRTHMLFRGVSEEFWKVCAMVINAAGTSLFASDDALLLPMIMADGTYRVYVYNRVNYYMRSKIMCSKTLKSVKSVSKYPVMPVRFVYPPDPNISKLDGAKADSILIGMERDQKPEGFIAKVPPCGVAIFDVEFE